MGMRSLSITAALIAATASVALGGPTTVALPRYTPKVGSKRTVTHDTTTTGTVTQNGKQEPITEHLTATFTVEALEVSTGTITKKRVAFTAAHVVTSTLGHREDEDLLLAGKTYIVENSLSHPFTTEDGSEVSTKERWALSQLRSANVPDSPGGLASGQSFTTGKKVTTKNALSMMFDLSLTAPAEIGIELTKFDANTATFSVTTKTTGKSLGLAVTNEATATVVVSRKLGVTTELTSEGVQTGKGKLGGDTVELETKVKTHETIEYP